LKPVLGAVVFMSGNLRLKFEDAWHARKKGRSRCRSSAPIRDVARSA